MQKKTFVFFLGCVFLSCLVSSLIVGLFSMDFVYGQFCTAGSEYAMSGAGNELLAKVGITEPFLANFVFNLLWRVTVTAVALCVLAVVVGRSVFYSYFVSRLEKAQYALDGFSEGDMELVDLDIHSGGDEIDQLIRSINSVGQQLLRKNKHLSKANRALSENREKLNMAIEGAGVGVFRWDINSGSIDIDDQVASILQLNKSGTMSAQDAFKGFLAEDKRMLVQKVDDIAVSWNGKFNFQARVKRAVSGDGLVEITAGFVPAFGAVTGVIRDITQDHLYKKIEQVNLSVSQIILKSHSLADCFGRIERCLRDMLPVNSLFLIRDVGGEWRSLYGTVSSDVITLAEKSRSVGSGVFSNVNQRGRSYGAYSVSLDETTFAVFLFDSLNAEESTRLVEMLSGLIMRFNIVIKDSQLLEQLEYRRDYDDLTGLPGRSRFLVELESYFGGFEKNDEDFSLLLLDMNRFKIINDTMGHACGDLMIKAISTRLHDVLSGKLFIGRIAGDEFAFLIRQKQEEEYLRILAKNILSLVSKPVMVNGRGIGLSASIGVISSADGYSSFNEMLRDADIAKYEAKKMHDRDNVCIFTEDMRKQLSYKLNLESELPDAIEKDEFFVEYQPIIDVNDGRVYALEALVRWKHPSLGVISPGVFIPLLEETNLIADLGWRVLEKVCRDFSVIKRKFGQDVAVSVNFSVRQLLHPDLISGIQRLFDKYGVGVQSLIIEITETLFLNDQEHAASIVAQIQEKGIRVSIDDFGSGYSSLGYLHNIPINTLKADRQFIMSLERGADRVRILETIYILAKNLGAKVVAEGVETEAQLEIVKAMGIEYVQGYYFARPLPLDRLVNFTVPKSRRLTSHRD